ncbi:MAG: hypothetical protein AAFR84_17120 [Pseudomonadota bacterium]
MAPTEPMGRTVPMARMALTGRMGPTVLMGRMAHTARVSLGAAPSMAC